MEKKSFPNKLISSKAGQNVSPKGNKMFGKSTVQTAKGSAGSAGSRKMVGFTGVSASKKL